MGNYCSIYHADFNRLVSLTGSHKKAFFLDKCVFWWQISKYTLDDSRIWFTRKLSEMAGELSMSERTVSRYLDEFERAGFIDRTCRLSASGKGKDFSVIKRLYIHVTDRLLGLLQKRENLHQEQAALAKKSLFSGQNGKIDSDIMAESLYKDKDYNPVNSTVSESFPVKNQEKPSANPEIAKENPSMDCPSASLIGERITERFGNYIRGMLSNVRKQHDLKFSDPDRLFAEVVFSVTQDVQWKGVENPHHRVNIIAKLLRNRTWKTPKGFYNHWDVGQHFKRKDRKAMEQAMQFKMEESRVASRFFNGETDSAIEGNAFRFESRLEDEYRYSAPERHATNTEQARLRSSLNELSISICSEESYLRQVETWIDGGKPSVSRALADSVAIKIAGLYAQREKIMEMMAGQGVVAS